MFNLARYLGLYKQFQKEVIYSLHHTIKYSFLKDKNGEDW